MNNNYEIVLWDVKKLIPYERNPVEHPIQDVTRMASILLEYGCRPPLLVRSNGEICDGHLRYLAAQKLEWEQVPVILVDDWTKAQIKAYRITSRKTAQWAEFNEELLKLEVDELAEMNFDMELLGFCNDEIAELMREVGDDISSENNAKPPSDFREYDEDVETQYCCPKCQYEWSGNLK